MDKDEVFYPHRGSPYDPSLWDDILLWFPGIAWFYYLLNGYAPRTINHYNPVNKCKVFQEKNLSLFYLSLNLYSIIVIDSAFFHHWLHIWEWYISGKIEFLNRYSFFP